MTSICCSPPDSTPAGRLIRFSSAGKYPKAVSSFALLRRPHIAARQGLVYVPDDRCLFRNLSARENLALVCRRSKAKLETAFEYFPPLESLMSRPAGVLSGGEQQMLVMARALLTRPRLLMVDELSMGLAPIVVGQLLPALRRAAVELGIGVLLVEQHVHLALGIADQAYVMTHGELQMSGTASTILSQLDSLEASYLGRSDSPATAAPDGHVASATSSTRATPPASGTSRSNF